MSSRKGNAQVSIGGGFPSLLLNSTGTLPPKPTKVRFGLTREKNLL